VWTWPRSSSAKTREAFAGDAYIEVALGGHFIGSAHTNRNYQSAFFEPKLGNSENVESWEEVGTEDMRTRDLNRWKDMLQEYQAPPIEESKKEALEAFVVRRKAYMPDAWY